jgi:DNA primase
MENVSVHAAALKAIEWFGLDPEAMSADSEESGGGRSGIEKGDDARSPKPNSKNSAPVEDKSAPNRPLKFRLEKLERNHPYLAERGLSQETVLDFGVGYCAKGMMAERIAIPIHNPEGHVVAYAGRWPGEPAEGTPKYKLPQGFRKSLELFNIDRASKEPSERPLVIVEGFFDCMRLHQHGCRKVVALMGSTMSAAQEELTRKHKNPQSHIIVMLDEDESGRAGREDIAARLAKVCFVRIHQFEKEDTQPEHLSAEDLQKILGGML